MSLNDALVAIARREWTRWGGPTERIDGSLTGFAAAEMEAHHPFWNYVGEYWTAVGHSLDGRDSPDWSGAFIAHCFRVANAGTRFPVQENPSVSVAQIESGGFPGLSLVNPSATTLAVGDLLWAVRAGARCHMPPMTFQIAKAQVEEIRAGTAPSFCSHLDIVVAVRDGEVDVIGGNVHHAVTRTTYRLDIDGHVRDGRSSFVGVIKNAL